MPPKRISRQPKINEVLTTTKKTPKSVSTKRKRKSASPALSTCSSLENKTSPTENNNTTTTNEFSQFEEYIKAKHALHLSKPLALPCREEQIQQVREFIHHNIINETSGSMYISGAPGTGKTAVVQHVIEELLNTYSNNEDDTSNTKSGTKFFNVFINCMGIRSPAAVYNKILEVVSTSNHEVDLKAKLAKRITHNNKNTKPIVIVLDEMDQLLTTTGTNELLYTLFEWTRLESTKLTLIGIANSLDLTVRHLPLLTATSSPKPSKTASTKKKTTRHSITPKTKKNGSKLSSSFTDHSSLCKEIQFTPYERPDIEKILESRMKEVGSQVFDPTAIKFVAAKVAANTGDMRKALNACQAALDANEKTLRPVLQVTADDGFNSSSPKKARLSENKIGIAAMSKILGRQKDDSELPLQQKIILGTLLKIKKIANMNLNYPYDGVKIPIPVSKFYDEYRKICTEKGFSWIDRSELTSVCSLLEDRSLVHVNEGNGTLKKSKNGGGKTLSKTGIFFDQNATEKILHNDPIVISITG